MIWRLAHPVLGLVAGLLVLLGLPVVLSLIGFGFGLGSVELLLILVVAVGTCMFVGTRSPSAQKR